MTTLLARPIPATAPPIRPIRSVLGSQVVEPSPEWRAIIGHVCAARHVSVEDLLNGASDDGVVACRYEVWATLRDRFGTSYPKIGMMTGGYHHTSVMHGIARHRGLR